MTRIAAAIPTALLISACAATQAAALSCLAPDVARAYQTAAEADATYTIVRGSFDFEQVAPPPRQGTADRAYVLRATFSGQALTADGFTAPLEGPVALEITCAGPWCGGMTPGTDYIAFLRNDDGIAILDLDPCQMWEFAEPTDEDVERLLTCATGGTCAPVLERGGAPDDAG